MHHSETSITKVEITHNGPLLVFGDIIVKKADGTEVKREKVTAFCRCGYTKNNPFCDGSHSRKHFSE